MIKTFLLLTLVGCNNITYKEDSCYQDKNYNSYYYKVDKKLKLGFIATRYKEKDSQHVEDIKVYFTRSKIKKFNYEFEEIDCWWLINKPKAPHND